MREIKFRGLADLPNGKTEFVYGYLSKDINYSTAYFTTHPYRIMWNEGTARHNKPVRDGTVGQYTNLKDKNGKEIYEGDIVICDRFDNHEKYQVIIEDIRSLNKLLFGSNLNYREIIGNIYDNPEFLKGDKI